MIGVVEEEDDVVEGWMSSVAAGWGGGEALVLPVGSSPAVMVDR